MSSLSKVYSEYLRLGASRQDLPALSKALCEAGLTSEGEVLAHHSETGETYVRCETGLYAGRTLYVGPRPPPAASYGDYWLDSCQLSVMVLLPFYVAPEERPLLSDEARASVEEQRSWFALHPVRWFQFRAFLQAAPLEPCPGAFELVRSTRGNELAPVTHLTCSEASLYLYWFGVTFSKENMWFSVSQYLERAPWAEPAREWEGESYFDDQYDVAISPSTLGVDPQETEGTEDDERRMLYGHYDAPGDVTFRTAVHMVYGIKEDDVPSKSDYAGRVLGRFHRPA